MHVCVHKRYAFQLSIRQHMGGRNIGASIVLVHGRARRLHSERREYSFVNELVPRSAGNRLDHRARKHPGVVFIEILSPETFREAKMLKGADYVSPRGVPRIV